MRTGDLQADTANDLGAASQERHADETAAREPTMTHKHNLDEFTPWKIESYELHDTYTHGEPPTDGDQPPVAVG